jgi:hypothetical protein
MADGFTVKFPLKTFLLHKPRSGRAGSQILPLEAFLFHASALADPPNHSVETGLSVNTGCIRCSIGTPKSRE